MKISNLFNSLFGVLIGAALVGGASWVLADGDTIHACVKPNSGEIKIMADGDDCKPKEIHLQWNEQGPPGPQGPQGEPGPQGDQGPAGISGYQKVSNFNDLTVTLAPGSTFARHKTTVTCPVGKKVLGGGCTNFNFNYPSQSVINNFISYAASDTTWECQWVNTTEVDQIFQPAAHATCATVAP